MSNTKLLLGGLMTGIAIGAATALLLAPQDGKTTRNDIKDKIHQLEVDLKKTKNKISKENCKVQDDIKADLKQKIDDLEKKLNALKKDETIA